MALEFSICEVRWERYRRVSENPQAREWLRFQAARGLAANTLDAYGRNLDAYLGFLASKGIPFDGVVRSTVGLYSPAIADPRSYFIAASRTLIWLASGRRCRGRRLSRA